jgi:hypothetical protein
LGVGGNSEPRVTVDWTEMAAAACVRVRERVGDADGSAQGYQIFHNFHWHWIFARKQKNTENNVIFNGFYWPPKISCYFTGQLKITKIYIGRPKIVDFLQCLFDCALGLIDQYKMARI